MLHGMDNVILGLMSHKFGNHVEKVEKALGTDIQYKFLDTLTLCLLGFEFRLSLGKLLYVRLIEESDRRRIWRLKQNIRFERSN